MVHHFMRQTLSWLPFQIELKEPTRLHSAGIQKGFEELKATFTAFKGTLTP
jgi:hypothetical protein